MDGSARQTGQTPVKAFLPIRDNDIISSLNLLFIEYRVGWPFCGSRITFCRNRLHFTPASRHFPYGVCEFKPRCFTFVTVMVDACSPLAGCKHFQDHISKVSRVGGRAVLVVNYMNKLFLFHEPE